MYNKDKYKMGVDGLSTLMKDKDVPYKGRISKKDTQESYPLSRLKGRKIAIEASGLIYKQNWHAATRAIEKHIFVYENEWSRPSVEDVLNEFKDCYRSFMIKLIGTGIVPKFIMEGSPPSLKTSTRQKRRDDNAKYIEKALNASKILSESGLNEFKDNLPYTFYPGEQHAKIAIDIMRSMNITIIQADHEAEGVCAKLVNDTKDPHHCFCALIEDSDIFMLGASRILTKFTSRNGPIEVAAYAFRDVLTSIFHDGESPSNDQLKRYRDQFQLLCILMGTDYYKRIKGIGPITILDHIIKNNISTYEDICRIEPKFKSIPYHEIMEVLKNNEAYSVIYESV